MSNVRKTFAVYDVKAKFFSGPQFHRNAAEALRAFGAVINGGGDNLLSKFPADYTLFELGGYDEDTGQFANLQAPISIANGLHCVESPEALKAVK